MTATVEQEIQRKGLTAPRVTTEDIEANIVAQYMFPASSCMPPGTYMPPTMKMLTLCVLVLRNGFTVTGESACVSVENYDLELGCRIARENAVKKIWPLMGYALCNQRAGIGSLSPENIAEVAHEVNRAYCAGLGDGSQVGWGDAAHWQRTSAQMGVDMHLADPDASVSASHESWMAEKERTGWAYGPVKDPERKLHPCMVPFKQLPPDQQAKDYIFRGVVHALRRFLTPGSAP